MNEEKLIKLLEPINIALIELSQRASELRKILEEIEREEKKIRDIRKKIFEECEE